jgi:hypothetical protein
MIRFRSGLLRTALFVVGVTVAASSAADQPAESELMRVWRAYVAAGEADVRRVIGGFTDEQRAETARRLTLLARRAGRHDQATRRRLAEFVRTARVALAVADWRTLRSVGFVDKPTDEPDGPPAPPYAVRVPDPLQMPYRRDEFRYRVIGFIAIGHSHPDDSRRRTGWYLIERGWKRFVEQTVVKQLNWGVRRIQIHSPFGVLSDEVYQFDQYLEAREAGFKSLVDGFVEAWRPVIRGDYTDGEPVEVIAYLGGLGNDQHFIDLHKAGDLDAWYARAWASMQPALDAGMSIGFDAVCGLPADHPAHKLIRYLRDGGVRVYIETWPIVKQPHWAKFNVIVTSQQMRVLQFDRIHLRHSDIAGEVVQLLTRIDYKNLAPHDAQRDLLERGGTILSGRNNLSTLIYALQKSNFTLDDLLAETRKARADK